MSGRELAIDGVAISDDGPCWVIAEIGNNHQGDLEKCKHLVREAKAAGASAVKLQKRDNRSLFTRDMFDRPYDHENSFGQTYGEHREFLEFAAKTQPKEKTHGSGCAFSAAITAGLANRLNLVDAIDQAKQLVNLAILHSDGQGRGTAPVNVMAFAPKKK